MLIDDLSILVDHLHGNRALRSRHRNAEAGCHILSQTHRSAAQGYKLLGGSDLDGWRARRYRLDRHGFRHGNSDFAGRFRLGFEDALPIRIHRLAVMQILLI